MNEEVVEFLKENMKKMRKKKKSSFERNEKWGFPRRPWENGDVWELVQEESEFGRQFWETGNDASDEVLR